MRASSLSDWWVGLSSKTRLDDNFITDVFFGSMMAPVALTGAVSRLWAREATPVRRTAAY
jgi:hypothetical protein